MAATPKVYVICDQNCKFEGMTKEQILTAIMQAINEGTIGDIDAGFITTIKTINGLPLRFFVGEQNEYDNLADEDKKGLFAIITNDTNKEALIKSLEDLKSDFEGLSKNFEKIVNGEILVGSAAKATKAGIYFLYYNSSNTYNPPNVKIGTWYDVGTIPEGKTINDIMLVGIKYIYDKSWALGIPPVIAGFEISSDGVEQNYYNVEFQLNNNKLQYRIKETATQRGTSYTYRNTEGHECGVLSIIVYFR